MKKTTEKSTEIGFEEWNTLADETVRQVKGLKLQLRIAEGILHQARLNRDNLRTTKKPYDINKDPIQTDLETGKPRTFKTPDTATDDVKTHAKQI